MCLTKSRAAAIFAPSLVEGRRGTEGSRAVGTSQDQFAETFHISAATLRKWERGAREPSGAAVVLLWLLTKLPDEILRAMTKR
jgi:hypothetical protein